MLSILKLESDNPRTGHKEGYSPIPQEEGLIAKSKILKANVLHLRRFRVNPSSKLRNTHTYTHTS